MFVKFLFFGRVVLKISMMIRSRAITKILTMIVEEGIGVQSSGACLIGRMSFVLSRSIGPIVLNRIAPSRLYLRACDKELQVSKRYNNRGRKVKLNMITVFV